MDVESSGNGAFDRYGTNIQGMQPGTLLFDVSYPENLSRGLIFIKWLLVVPHLVVLYFLQIGVAVVTVIAWFAILFTGSYPRDLWNFVLMVQRWQTNVTMYFVLLRDEYPPFASGPYPVRYDIEYPPRLSRGLIFIKWLLVIPHVFVLAILGCAMFVVFWIAFIAILVTGRYPRGLFNFMVGFYRWSTRVNLYTYLMTDVYPPFSME